METTKLYGLRYNTIKLPGSCNKPRRGQKCTFSTLTNLAENSGSRRCTTLLTSTTSNWSKCSWKAKMKTSNKNQKITWEDFPSTCVIPFRRSTKPWNGPWWNKGKLNCSQISNSLQVHKPSWPLMGPLCLIWNMKTSILGILSQLAQDVEALTKSWQSQFTIPIIQWSRSSEIKGP